MKLLFRYIRYNRWLWLLLAVTAIALCSCAPTRYVPVETVKVDSVRVVEVMRDSVFVKDSVFVREKNDTVFLTKWHTVYREVLRVDTFQVLRVDSINTVVEVEKKLTKIQQLKMDVGAGVLYAVPILIVVGLYILYRKLKK